MFMVLAQTESFSWKKMEDRGLLAHADLIMAGDMNFTLNSDEIWGLAALTDPLAVFFKDLFDNSFIGGCGSDRVGTNVA
jgi:hypothetical protein